MGINWDWSGIGKGFEAAAGAIGDYRSRKHQQLTLQAKQLFDTLSTTDPNSPMYAQAVGQLDKIANDLKLEGVDTMELDAKRQQVANKIDMSRPVPGTAGSYGGRRGQGGGRGLPNLQGVYGGAPELGISGEQFSARDLSGYNQYVHGIANNEKDIRGLMDNRAQSLMSDPNLLANNKDLVNQMQGQLETGDYGGLGASIKRAEKIQRDLDVQKTGGTSTFAVQEHERKEAVWQSHFDARNKEFDRRSQITTKKEGGRDEYIRGLTNTKFQLEAIDKRLKTTETRKNETANALVQAFSPSIEPADLNFEKLDANTIKSQQLNAKILSLTVESDGGGRTPVEFILALNQLAPNGNYMHLSPAEKSRIAREHASDVASFDSMYGTGVTFEQTLNFIENIVEPAMRESQLTPEQLKGTQQLVDNSQQAREVYQSVKADTFDERYRLATGIALSGGDIEVGGRTGVGLTPQGSQQIISVAAAVEGLQKDVQELGKKRDELKKVPHPRSQAQSKQIEQVNLAIHDKFVEIQEYKQVVVRSAGMDTLPDEPLADVNVQIGENLPPVKYTEESDDAGQGEMGAFVREKNYPIAILRVMGSTPEYTAAKGELMTGIEAATGKKVTLSQFNILIRTLIGQHDDPHIGMTRIKSKYEGGDK